VENDLIPKQAFGEFPVPEESAASVKAQRTFTRICYNCRQPGHYANECSNPRQQKPQQQNQNPGSAKGNHSKKPGFQVKQTQLNFMGNISIQEHLPTLSFTFKSQDEILFKGGRL
jgi:type II secretory ATPase GspE/PulE/Tfp pilus assembly ATPase PilB-like protein